MQQGAYSLLTASTQNSLLSCPCSTVDQHTKGTEQQAGHLLWAQKVLDSSIVSAVAAVETLPTPAGFQTGIGTRSPRPWVCST
jgi:hypothetical protein